MGRALRVLIVEDRPDDAELMIRALRRGGLDPEWERVETAAGLRAALAAGAWDIVLSDYTLPEFDATAALEIVRAADPDLPFLAVSGTVGEEVAAATMRAGANDYVLKQNLVRLAPAVERELREVSNRRASRREDRATARLAAIVDSSDDAIISMTLDGIVASWNRAAERLHGWAAEEAIGRHISFIVPPDKDEEFTGVMERLRRDEHFERLETVRLHRDGTRRDVSITASLIRDRDGRVSGISKVARDIGERKRAEVALRDKEAKLAEAVRLARLGYWSRNLTTGTLDWSDLLYDIFGVDPTAFGGTFASFLAAVHPDDREAVHNRIADAVAAAGSFDHTYRIIARGEVRVIHEVGHVIAENGSPVRVTGTAQDITERRRTETELQASEARFRALVENSWDGVTLVDGAGIITYATAATTRVLGYPLAEYIGRHGSEFVHPDDQAGTMEVIVRIGSEPGRTETCTYRYRHRDGSWRWVETIVTNLLADPHVRALVLNSRDVTASRAAEEALRASEARYRTLIATSSAIVWGSPASGAFDSDQPAWTAFTGQTVDQHRGWGWLDVIHPDDRDTSARAWATAVRDRTEYQLDHRLRRADGEYREMFVRAVPIFDSGGAIREWVGVHTDVTDRQRAERAVRQAQERLQHVLASSPAVLFTMTIADDQIQGINWISDNLGGMLGYAPADAFGPDWWIGNVHPEDRDALVAQTRVELFGQGYVAHEYRFRHRNGQYRWTRSDIRLIRDATGRAEAVGAWSDVTARRSLEEQFRQAQKMEAVGQLAGGVAHDFNNLLTVISGYSDIILSAVAPDDPVREFVRNISVAGERAAALTRQLLAFSRKTVLEPKVLDLNEVVRETGKLLQRLIGEDVLLTTVLDPTIDRVKVDPDQLGQVLMNLAVNARDAMPRGGNLTVETRTVELDREYARSRSDVTPGRYVMMSVSDSGTGMTEDVKSHIFEPFFTTKGVGKGTGLGLAVVIGVIKQSGGHVAVYSELGRGTTFKIYLPAVEERTAAAASRSDSGDLRGTETVLLAEDEDGVRGLAVLILQTHGYKVLVARDGRDAVRVAAGHEGPIDLLVTDVVMPNAGGRELAEALRPRFPLMKVLYTSGYTDDAVVRNGILHEESPFIQKPYSPRALLRKVRLVLTPP